MTEEPAKPEQGQQAPEEEKASPKPQRYLYVLVAAERLANYEAPPEGWSVAEVAIDDKIKGKMKFTVSEPNGKIKLDLEK